MGFKMLRKERREAGLALILAIGFLGLLSILGAVVMRVATMDLSSTTTTLPNQRALYAADRAVEYSMNRDIIINLLPFTSVNLKEDFVKTGSGSDLTVKHKEVIDSTGQGFLESGKVADVGPRNLPPHLAAIHGSEFGANLYHVNVETKSTFSKTIHVDASIVRLFKMDDDQIFRTSGGG